MFNEKIRVSLMGLSFLFLLLVSSVSNTLFLNSLGVLYQNQILLFSMIFMNNVIVISLIILGMTFYVNLVTLGFFKNEKYPNVIIDNPRIFALIFLFIVLFFGVLRGVNHFFGTIAIELLPIIFLLNTPIGIVEGYGVFLAIEKILHRKLTLRNLIYIFVIFSIAALIEVCMITIID